MWHTIYSQEILAQLFSVITCGEENVLKWFMTLGEMVSKAHIDCWNLLSPDLKKKKKRRGRRSSQKNWLDYKGINNLRIKITQKFWDLESKMLCQESIDVIIKT